MHVKGLFGVSMEGEVHPTGKIKVKEAFVDVFSLNWEERSMTFKLLMKSFEPVEIIFKDIKNEKMKVGIGLTNFVFKEPKETKADDGFTVDLKDFSIDFRPHENYDYAVTSLENSEETVLVTSEAFIDLPSTIDFDISKKFDGLFDLISYACRTRVSPLYENYYFENTLFKTVLRPVFTSAFVKNNYLLSKHNLGRGLKFYLENCFTYFLEHAHHFALNIVIAMYLEGIKAQYQDMGFLLLATSLESLLEGYAEVRRKEGEPIPNSLISRNKRDISKILDEHGIKECDEISKLITDKISYKNLNILNKLNALVKDDRYPIKLDRYDRDFATIRNEIAHTGKTPKIINSSGKKREISLNQEKNRLTYLIDKIILTILNYKDKPFINQLDGSKIVLD